MTGRWFPWLAAAQSLLLFAGCRQQAQDAEGTPTTPPVERAPQSIQVKGSDTMVNLSQAWAEAFMKSRPEASIAVTGGGSGTGIAALVNGTADLAQASRDMKSQEIEQARARGIEVEEHTVALDALTVAVHPSNPVKQLTVAQLSDIYTAKVKNWKQLGGPDRRIAVLSRDKNSGTHVFFLEHVVRRGDAKGPEQYAPETLLMVASKSIAEEVAVNRDAIGYFGIGYLDEQRHQAVAIAAKEGGPYVQPSAETVRTGEYAVARPLHFYAPKDAKPLVREFIAFALSPEGQEIVKTQEFVPLPQEASAPAGG